MPLTETELKMISRVIEASVEKSVTDTVPIVIQREMETRDNKQQIHMDADKEWKDNLMSRIQPALEAFEKGTAGYKFFVGLGKILVPIGALIGFGGLLWTAVVNRDWKLLIKIFLNK